MSRRRHPIALLLVACAALASSVGSARAAGSITVTNVDTSRYPTITASVKTAGAKVKGAPAFTATENGRPLKVSVSDGNAGTAIALLIDASQSMRGAPLNQAVAAVRQFVSEKRRSDQVAVYTFGKTANQLAPMSSDGTPVLNALGQVGVSSAPGTALRDAVVLASSDLAQVDASRRVAIVLTDGTDNTSHATARQATDSAKQNDVVVYAVHLQSPGASTKALRTLAVSTGGAFFDSGHDAASIHAVYRRIADDIRSTYRLQYTTALGNVPTTLRVALAGVGSTRAQYRPTNATTSQIAGKPDAAGSLVTSFGSVGIALAVGVCVLLGVLMVLRPRPEVSLSKRIERYSAAQQKKIAQKREGLPLFKQIMIATERAFGQLKYWKRLAGLLEQADLPMRASEVVYIQFGAGIVALLIASAIFGGPGIMALVFAAIGFAAPFFFVKFKAGKRRKLFESQLADTLVATAASLRAGHSFAQAIATIVKEAPEPSNKEFARVENETRLGRPTDQALEAMAQRIGSKNFEFVVLAVNIQRQVGGSLAEILDMVADTVREREQFARKVKALTSMGRASAYVLIGMPFFIGFAIYLMKPNYMSPLLFTSTGHMMIIVGLIMISIGTVIIRKMVNFTY